jgi:HSP20 family protein
MAELKEANRTTETKKTSEKELARRPSSLLEPWDGWSVFPTMQRFAEEMDRLFEDFGFLRPQRRRPSLISRMFGRQPEEPEVVTWAPRVEMVEREGQLVIHADLPGLTKDDIKVELTDDTITIQGERKEEKKEEKKGYYYNECRYGSFFRSIPLPEGVDTSKATAEFRNGVLEVVMPAPKREETKGRLLEIKG